MSQPIDYKSPDRTIEQEMGLKPLNKWWAKAEIVLGLFCVWLAMNFRLIHEFTERNDSAWLVSAGLFILGGYLAMAGSRSHLYQSANRQIEFLWRELKNRAP